MITYDVIVIGAGAAGIFSARELGLAGAKTLMVDMGPPLASRGCPRIERNVYCAGCEPCSILAGWGGAGAFSDGKLSLSKKVGGFLEELLEPTELDELLDYVDSVYLAHGATHEIFGTDWETFERLRLRAGKHGLVLAKNPVRHMGTDICRSVLGSLYNEVSSRVDLLFNACAERIIAKDGAVSGVVLDNRTVKADRVILAPGRVGSEWAGKVCRELSIPTRPNPVDVGVRVECPAKVMGEVTEALYEAKLFYRTPTFDDEVRTFCMNPRGEVVHEVYNDCLTVNGHAYAAPVSELTNFALLVKTSFTEPFDDPVAYGKSVARMANLLGDTVLVQRYRDLAEGKRSTPERIGLAKRPPTLTQATPGDLSFALPHRHMVDLIETIEALDGFCPGIVGPDTFLYGAEVKLYSTRLALDANLQTPVKNLYGAGDGVGVSRGLMQASVSGVKAARAILAD